MSVPSQRERSRSGVGHASAAVCVAALVGCQPPPSVADTSPPPTAADVAATRTEAASDPSPGGESGAQASADDSAASAPDPAAGPPSPGFSRPLDKTFDDIKFEMEVGAPFDRGLLTDPIRALDGARIRIRGYILPTMTKRGIKQFVLVRDNQECCFGPGAALYDCVLVTMQPGKTTEYSLRSVAVEGRFTIDEFVGPDGYPLAIYRMEGESVE